MLLVKKLAFRFTSHICYNNPGLPAGRKDGKYGKAFISF